MNLHDAAIIDFETMPIVKRPVYPPAPVGVAIDLPGKKPRYYAFAHPMGGNNCSFTEARQALGEAYDSGRPLVFHNAKFDVEVAEVEMGMKRVKHDRYHDTLPMLFLLDPRAPDYKLKPASERYLGVAPDERDAVEEWLLEHQPVPGVKLSKSPKSEHYAGAYIAYAPVSLVGPYAIGDLTRTRGIASYAVKELTERRMWDAYITERDLLMTLINTEKEGVRVDRDRLAKDVARYSDEREQLERWLVKRLKCSPSLNFDSGAELVDALLAADCADRALLGVTEKSGKVQTNKEALDRGVTEPQVLATLRYRSQLNTCLRMFMEPWLETSTLSDGRIFTQWHSTRNECDGATAGTRTGRLSSTPNFQNIAGEFKPHFYEEAIVVASAIKDVKKKREAIAAAKLKPKFPFKLSPMPRVRGYIVPYAEGDVLLGRDFSSQEYRILAHFEDGDLAAQYKADPWTDVHDFVTGLIIEKTGIHIERKETKIVGFSILYGSGIGHLAETLACATEQAKELKGAYGDALPGIVGIQDLIKARVKADMPIRTWGGREYYVEPPVYMDGRYRDFTYKLLNVLIQGSAADCTKRAFLNFERDRSSGWRLFLNVHDELVVSAPEKEKHDAMECLRVAMESVPFDVPMLSEGEWSPDNWAAMQTYDEKGVRVCQ